MKVIRVPMLFLAVILVLLVNFLVPSLINAQQEQRGIISGRVTAATGEALPGANVTVVGTTVGAATDPEGRFVITIPPGTYSVRAAFIGYESATVENITVIEGQTTQANFSLTTSALLGEEIIVTALGISKEKKALTYSAQDLKNEELTRVKNANLLNSLSGKISGIAVNRSSSGSGGTAKITIRGNSSTRNNRPLYVIDGVPIQNTSPEQGNAIFGQNSDGNINGNRDGGDIVSLINPDDIESISVLKGASASALYGSQGANGVILITTKKGRPGKPTINVSSSTTFDQVVNLPKFQTDYTAASGAETSWDGSKSSFENHVDGFFKGGLTQISSVSFSSGTEKAQTYFSYANTHAEGVIPTNQLTKHNFTLRETVKFFDDKLSIDASISLADQKIHNKPVSGLYYNVLTGLYLFPRGNNFDSYREEYETFDATRNLMAQNWLTDSHIDQNPYWILNRNQNDDRNQHVLASTSFGFKVSDHISLRSRLSYDKFFNTYEKKAYATTQTTLAHENGRYILIKDDNVQLYADLIATFTKQLSDDFELTTNTGASISNSKIGDNISFDSFTSPGLDKANWFTLANFNGISNNFSAQSVASEREIQSLFGSALVGYKDMLYAEISARNDWSSTLVNTDNLSFFYPSFGLTGIISEMTELPEVIDFAKVRGSYAEVGRDIPSFITSPRNSIQAGVVSGPNTGPRPGVSLKPEIQKSFELGTDWRFFGSRLNFELTWYKSNTENQYIVIQAPDTNPFGYQNYAFNAGDVENTGVEVVLSGAPIKKEDFTWRTTLNLAKNKNTVSGIPDDADGRIVLSPPGVNGYQYVLENGKPFGVIEAKKLIRDDQGRIQLDADGNLQKGGFEEVGNAILDFTLGWANAFDYKNFSLNIHIDGRFGGEVMSVTEAMLDGFGVSKRSADARNAGGVTINAVDANGNAVTSYDAEKYYTTIGNRAGALGEYIYSATNISLRELSLAYRLNLKNRYIKAASISLVGRNLFIIKDAPYDPNISLSTGEGLQGVDVFGLPLTRSIGFNVNLTY